MKIKYKTNMVSDNGGICKWHYLISQDKWSGNALVTSSQRCPTVHGFLFPTCVPMEATGPAGSAQSHKTFTLRVTIEFI